MSSFTRIIIPLLTLAVGALAGAIYGYLLACMQWQENLEEAQNTWGLMDQPTDTGTDMNWANWEEWP